VNCRIRFVTQGSEPSRRDEKRRVTAGMEGTEMCTKQSKTSNNKNNLEYLGVDSKIILKEILA
jgi:hypothetical protein